MRVTPYGQRFWAVYDEAEELVCVTVYRKGAEEVVRRLRPPNLEEEDTPLDRLVSEPANACQKSALRAVAGRVGWEGDRIHQLSRQRFGKAGLDDLSKTEARTLLHEIIEGGHSIALSQ